MKIAVTGKGGVGKTFIAGTLAEIYAREGRPKKRFVEFLDFDFNFKFVI